MLSALCSGARLLRAAFVLLRHDAFAFLDDTPQLRPPRPARFLLRLLAKRRTRNTTRAQRLSDALQRLGPSYIKLGQFLATRPDIIGTGLAEDLSVLQDRLQPFSQEEARADIEQELGEPVQTLFAEFGPSVAAASIAQVHRCRLPPEDLHSDNEAERNGREVAVKILRPGIEKRFARDLADFVWIAGWIETLHPPSRRLRPRQVVATLAASVRQEMDLRMEAAALSEIAANTPAEGGFRVPRLDWKRTSQRVLTTDWIDGIPLSDLDAVRAAGFDMKALATRLIRIFLRQAMEDGFFHADMHPGNLFLEADGTIAAVDFGIVSRLNPDEQRFLAGVLHGFLQRDYRHVAELHFQLGYVPEHKNIDDFALALRAIGEPITDKDAREISMGRLLMQLFQVTAQFDMPTQPRLLLLQKTMVVVEGVARNMDPEHNMWESAKPVARRWMEQNVGLEAQLRRGGEELRVIAAMLRRLPHALETGAEVLRRIAEREAAVHSIHPGRGRRIARRLIGLLLLGGLAGAVGWLLGRISGMT